MIRKNTVVVTWKGVDKVTGRFEELPRAIRRGVLQALSAIALVLQNRCRAALQRGPKTGRVNRKSTGVIHQASAPGEFPATDTGTLVRSVLGEVKKTTLEAVLSASTIYAKWLELGTRKMLPRPFLVPTLEIVKEEAVTIIKKFVKMEVRK